MKNRYIVIINTILFTKFFPSLMLFRIPPWGWIFEKRMAISGQPAHSSAEKHSSGTVPKRTLNIVISCLNCHTTSNLLFRGGKRFHDHFSGTTASGSATVVIRSVKKPQNRCPDVGWAAWPLLDFRRTSILPGMSKSGKKPSKLGVTEKMNRTLIIEAIGKQIQTTYHILVKQSNVDSVWTTDGTNTGPGTFLLGLFFAALALRRRNCHGTLWLWQAAFVLQNGTSFNPHESTTLKNNPWRNVCK